MEIIKNLNSLYICLLLEYGTCKSKFKDNRDFKHYQLLKSQDITKSTITKNKTTFLLIHTEMLIYTVNLYLQQTLQSNIYTWYILI